MGGGHKQGFKWNWDCLGDLKREALKRLGWRRSCWTQAVWCYSKLLVVTVDSKELAASESLRDAHNQMRNGIEKKNMVEIQVAPAMIDRRKDIDAFSTSLVSLLHISAIVRLYLMLFSSQLLLKPNFEDENTTREEFFKNRSLFPIFIRFGIL